VAIHVRVPAYANPGQEIEYRIVVENFSQAPAHHVIVRDPVPANARFVRANPEPSSRDPELTWQLGTLEAGGKRELVLVLAPKGTEDVNNCARVQFEHGQCVRTTVNKPSFNLHKEGPAQGILNESLTYKLTLTNTGIIELTNVLLADILDPGLKHGSGKNRLSWIVGTVAPGQSHTVDYQVVATVTGRLCNKAIATVAGDVRQQVDNCVTVGEAKLKLAMSGPHARYLNAPASYQIAVSNPGSVPLANVVIQNPLPGDTSFVSASDGGQFNGNLVQWNIGSLAPGGSQTVELALRAQAPGRICNHASASSDHGLISEAEACTEFVGVPALALDVADTMDPVEVGGTTTYNITVRNPGTNPATNVRIIATVPEQLEVTQAAGSTDNRKMGNRLIYEPLTLRAGGEARYRIDVKAKNPGDVRFKVELTADALQAGPVQQEESTTIYSSMPTSRFPWPEGTALRFARGDTKGS
jgi:uncharacterized repeat protein (TIGR01451 family)